MRKITFIVIICLFVCSLACADPVVRIAPLTYSIQAINTTVNTTATAIPTTALGGRESIAIYNNDASTVTVYIGGASVNASNGFPLTSSAPAVTLDLDDSVTIYAIVASGTADIRTIEAK